jgi:AcrR family transcriptional regulator
VARQRTSRPRSGLTREKILDAAVAFVDEHGPDALSTRRLGAALGVEGMTLYYYVPNKAALLDGMVERLLLDAGTALDPAAADRPWPETVRAVAGGLRAALLRHPGMLTVIATRPVASPTALGILEYGLAALRAQQVPLDLALDVLNAAVTFTIGHTLAEAGRTPGADTDEADASSGTDAAPGTDAAAAAGTVDHTRFPHLAEAYATGAGLDAERRFTRTLGMIIAGYAELVRRAAPTGPTRGAAGPGEV